MEIGKLRTRVDVLSRVDIIDECGGSEPSWAITRRIWGSVRDSYSHESTSAQGILAQTDAEIFARYNTFCLAEIGYDKSYIMALLWSLARRKTRLIRLCARLSMTMKMK